MNNKKKRCPLLKGKPCMGDECMFYRSIQLVNNSTNPPEMVIKKDCVFINQETYMRDMGTAVFQQGAAIESLRNELIKESKIARQESQQQHSENINQNITLPNNLKPNIEYSAHGGPYIIPNTG